MLSWKSQNNIFRDKCSCPTGWSSSLRLKRGGFPPNLLAALVYGEFLRSDKVSEFSNFLQHTDTVQGYNTGFWGHTQGRGWGDPKSPSYQNKSCFIFPLLYGDISGTLEGSWTEMWRTGKGHRKQNLRFSLPPLKLSLPQASLLPQLPDSYLFPSALEAQALQLVHGSLTPCLTIWLNLTGGRCTLPCCYLPKWATLPRGETIYGRNLSPPPPGLPVVSITGRD